MTITQSEFKSRGRAALGGHGWMARMSRGIGKDYTTVIRWANGDLSVPAYAVAVLELLEAVPRDQHPSRFR